MELITSSSKLDTIIPCTGGKVGAPNLRRESVDGTLEFIQDALFWLKAYSRGVGSFTQVLLSRDKERVVTLSIEGSEGRSLSSLKGPERSTAL